MSEIVEKMHDEMHCSSCGAIIKKEAVICVKCGVPNKSGGSPQSNNFDTAKYGEKSQLTALILCFFVGWLGVHRFYVGKVGTGILMLFTGGGFGLWWFIDFIFILTGSFKDADGNKLQKI